MAEVSDDRDHSSGGYYVDDFLSFGGRGPSNLRVRRKQSRNGAQRRHCEVSLKHDRIGGIIMTFLARDGRRDG